MQIVSCPALTGPVGSRIRVMSLSILVDMGRTQYSIFENDESKKAFKERMMKFIVNCVTD